MSNISAILNQLRARRRQAQQELQYLDSAINALKGLTTASSHGGRSGNNVSSPRRTMSAAARKKIADAQRARWAAWKAKQKKAA